MSQNKKILSPVRWWGALGLLSLLMLSGCGQKTTQITSEQNKAFDTAAPDVKQVWDKAMAADKASDFVAAQAALTSLTTMTLTEPQRKALEEERAAFGQRLMQAADKDNPAAIQVVKAMLKNPKNR